MTKRRALLIGVPEYYKNPDLALPVVRQDLQILELALKKANFDVTLQGLNDPQESSDSQIKAALKKACRDAKKGDTLLLYYSGHGVHFNGKDYLVSYNTIFDVDDKSFEDSLVSCDYLDDAPETSQAETIIFFIDACREGIRSRVKSIPNREWGSLWDKNEWKKVARRKFLRVFSCSTGQYSRFISGEQGFSLFTKALTDVFNPDHPACTLEEILEATQVRLDELAEEFSKDKQNISWFHEQQIENSVLQVVLLRSCT